MTGNNGETMKQIDMRGQRHGRLTVVDYAETIKGHAKWKCKCDCGNEIIVDGGNLRTGHTTSCGHCERYTVVDETTVRCDLPTGESFLIDASDLAKVSKHRWSIENSGYVHTTIGGKHIRLHNYLMGKTSLFVDHINGDRSDNRRSNLRLCTNKENIRNQRISKRNTSGYKGVSYDTNKGKYGASITVDGYGHFLGYFVDPKEAARAYDRAALKYFGEFARPNLLTENG